MFDLARFRRLAAATWSENRRPWGWFFLVAILVHVLLVLGIAAIDRGYEAFAFEGQGTVWFWGLFLLAPIFAGRYFQAMARRESAGVLLMQPASAFEKWLLAVLVVAVLYPVAYYLAFQIAGAPAYFYGKALATAHHAETLVRLKPSLHAEWNADFAEKWRYFVPVMERNEWLSVLPVLLTLQGLAMLGSLYFRSLPIIKTFAVAFVLLLVVILAGAVLEGDSGLFFGYWEGDALLAPWQAVLLPVAWLGVPALLWLASFVALREREVA